jgi:hypothetical protein
MNVRADNREEAMKKFIGMGTLALMLLSTAAFGASCHGESDEERQLRESREWAIHTMTEGETPPPKPRALPSELSIIVPPEVEERYKAVKMKVYTYATESYESFNVDIPGKASVPGTDYTIEVLNYMPSWTTKDHVLTIKTVEEARPDPAIRCIITDGSGEQVFNGFIFQLHKTPSFKTEEHVIGLVGVVESGE